MKKHDKKKRQRKVKGKITRKSAVGLKKRPAFAGVACTVPQIAEGIASLPGSDEA